MRWVARIAIFGAPSVHERRANTPCAMDVITGGILWNVGDKFGVVKDAKVFRASAY